jgi:hypothetical protein
VTVLITSQLLQKTGELTIRKLTIGKIIMLMEPLKARNTILKIKNQNIGEPILQKV